MALGFEGDQRPAIAIDPAEPPCRGSRGLSVLDAGSGQLLGAFGKVKRQLVIDGALGSFAPRPPPAQPVADHDETFRGAGPSTLKSASAERRQLAAWVWRTR